MNIRPFILLLSLSILMFSCSVNDQVFNKGIIQNRKYTKGASLVPKQYVDIAEISDNAIIETKIESNEQKPNFNTKKSIVASNEKTPTNKTFVLNRPAENGVSEYIETTQTKPICDEIILRDGTIIEGRVLKITDTQIIYLTCDQAKQEVVIEKNSVFLIKYYTGDNEVVTPFNDSIVNQVNKPESNLEKQNLNTTDQMASASISLGFISVICTLLLSALGGAVLGLLAIIFGLIGIGNIGSSGRKKTGVVQAALGILFGVASIAIFIWFINYLAGQ